VRVYLDANILFSAAATDGAIRRLIDDLVGAGHRLVADAYVWTEADRNLALHYPDRREHLESLRTALELHSHFAGAGKELAAVPLPEKDLPVLASAVSLSCQTLLTGDRTHFGALYGRKIAGVTILSPRGVAEILLKE
jgi:uncharacterized protein